MTGSNGWKAITGPAGKTYYYNSVTHETSWQRPAEMEDEAPTPAATQQQKSAAAGGGRNASAEGKEAVRRLSVDVDDGDK